MSHIALVSSLLCDSDSDDELENLALTIFLKSQNGQEDKKTHGGSVPGQKYIWGDRAEGHNRLYKDYFADDPVYHSNLFRRRFRMRRPLFIRIQSVVENHDTYFKQKPNAAGIMGLSSLQKITAVLRMLCYGVSSDFVDEYVRIGESTSIESMKRFVTAIVEIFSEEYLRSPTDNDIAKLLETSEQRGFPGMLGSIDCMHWKWKNCPATWKGMFTGHIHEPTIVLEAVASYDLWIWHAFFGLPGSHNDINVLDRSPVFSNLIEGRAPPVNYSINGHNYTMGYYLADGIYPLWANFVKTISAPQGNKNNFFAQAQESARKDVERAFGVLQARFDIVRGPARFWNLETLTYVMKCCIILHNMIVEDERDDTEREFNYDTLDNDSFVEVSREKSIELSEFIKRHQFIRSKDIHTQLQHDLLSICGSGMEKIKNRWLSFHFPNHLSFHLW